MILHSAELDDFYIFSGGIIDVDTHIRHPKLEQTNYH